MEDNISKVKDRVDVVDVIGGYIKLQKAGVNFKARCPFHNEKSGSFFVSPERQIWHCFGCGLGGDVFGFVKQIEGVEFGDALRMLAQKAGIQLSYTRPEERDSKVNLHDINELATRFFEKQLGNSSAGKEALKYLKDRGLSDESIRSFRLGYSPDSWDSLSNFLQKEYSPKEIVDAGLIIKSDKRDGHFDRFRSRIMFPINDITGRVVGFTGRVFGELAKKDDVGKYVNSPQTAIYDKSKILYGLDKARLDIRRENKCLIVEGNMDVIMSNQAGVSNVVASSGTALTEGHIKMLKRYTDSLDLCFDMDSAGATATERGVGLALAYGFNIGIISINEKDLKDPADYVKKHGNKWVEYVSKAKPFMEHYISFLRSQVDLATAIGKKTFSQKFLPLIASISNKVEQSHWLNEMAVILKVKEEILWNELASTKPLSGGVVPENKVTPVLQDNKEELESFDMLEESLLGMLFKNPSLESLLVPEYSQLLSNEFNRILERLRNSIKEDPKNAIKKVMEFYSKPDGKDEGFSIDFAYIKSQELWNEIDDASLTKEAEKLLKYIKRRKIVSQLESLEYDIKEAEMSRDEGKLTSLIEKFSKLSKEI